ncbi:MAG: 50S ribosomal protein L11 methyltransferase [Desulfovibrio sp.]|jgi:ribosomal protein L11 methyltransferase|nr:50S ribosomal protein L11 methyltransferase [Desulfovibrio sp.]
MKSCFYLDISVCAADAERLGGILAMYASCGWEERDISEGETLFRVGSGHIGYILKVRDAVRENMPEAVCRLTETEDRDWLASWREYFTPVECGSRFVVLPPWLVRRHDCAGRTPVVIEPGSAFGTGHHATTALCLSALGDLLDSGRIRPGQRFLDIGTGTGILAIACAKSGLSGLALDIDPVAVDNALKNRALNEAGDFKIVTGGMECAAEEAADKPYDVILSNILAGPLRELATEITQALAGDGCLLLSGILEKQADSVEAAYAAEGMPKARRLHDGEWVALVWS